MRPPDEQLADGSELGGPLPVPAAIAGSDRRADEDGWVGTALAREERLTRLLSYGSLFFGLVAPVIGVGALIAKFIQG